MMEPWLIFTIIGMASGIAIGIFGVGGGIVLVPSLIYWARFSQHKATGTTIAVLLPPIGLAAALEYYRHGNVDFRAAIILACAMFIGSWAGAYIANKMDISILQLIFGLFICIVGIKLVYSACRNLGWI